MKRSPELSPLAADLGQGTSFPAQKKFKAAARVSLGISVPDGGSTISSAEEGSWTKVEKRKAKKMRKTEAKLDVCVSLSEESFVT